ncbi:hypothetical protein BJX64DRAFT_273148 [Aspergillus heterothallicus]
MQWAGCRGPSIVCLSNSDVHIISVRPCTPKHSTYASDVRKESSDDSNPSLHTPTSQPQIKNQPYAGNPRIGRASSTDPESKSRAYLGNR